MTTWSQQTWAAYLPIYHKILEQPFIKELMAGSLSAERFEFYIRQDALYLADFGKVLAGIAIKLENMEETELFLRFSTETIQVERALHESFLAQFNQLAEIEVSPSCLLYTSYLYRMLQQASVEEALAAVLPCFWIYKEVGDYISEHQKEGENPFQSWIDTYSGEAFGQSVQQAIAVCDRYAAQSTESKRQAMMQAYQRSAQLEWLFWDSAYRLETWPVK